MAAWAKWVSKAHRITQDLMFLAAKQSCMVHLDAILAWTLQAQLVWVSLPKPEGLLFLKDGITQK